MTQRVTMRSMSDETHDASQPTTPRATHEFRLEAEVREQGLAYVRYRDGDSFRVVALVPASSVLYIGRDEGCAVEIQNDGLVSRRHARLIFGAGQWSIEDGPSRNGTYVEGRRTVGEHILADGARISVGSTTLSFHAPASKPNVTTLVAPPTARRLRPTSTQRKVLVELARPFMVRGAEFAVAPTNAAIAATLGYQVTTIRDAISDLYHQAGLARGTAEQRAALVRLAIREGSVLPEDFT